MRTIQERRHLSQVAVKRQIRIAASYGIVHPSEEVLRQPHRLHKTHLARLGCAIEGARETANPRRRAGRDKDRLKLTELSALERMTSIEMVDLDAAGNRELTAQEFASSSKALHRWIDRESSSNSMYRMIA